MRSVLRGVLLATLLLAVACSDDDDGGGAGTAAELPDGPAACAGAPRDGLAEGHAFQWDAAVTALEADPAARVWLGFSRVLSVADVGKLLEPLTVHHVLLVYEENQGTYLKAQGPVPDVPADDPAVRDAARALLGEVGGRTNPLPIGSPDALQPADPAVASGDPPIAGLVASGDIATAIDADPCLIHSMAPGDLGSPSAISPAVEPDPIRIDAG